MMDSADDLTPAPVQAALASISTTDLPTLTSRPDKFLAPNPHVSIDFMSLTARLYDLVKHAEPFPGDFSPLQTLLVDGFDPEQVWEQLQLQNAPMIAYLAKKVQDVVEAPDSSEDGDGDQEEVEEADEETMVELDGEGPTSASEDEDAMDLDVAADEGDDSAEEADEWADGFGENADEDEGEEGEEDASAFDGEPKPLKRKSEIDDDFFSLQEMEDFADFGEARDLKKARRSTENDGEESSEDEYTFGDAILNGDGLEDGEGEDDDGGDNANDIRYEDFFGPRGHHGEVIDGYSERPRSFRPKADREEFGNPEAFDRDEDDDEEAEDDEENLDDLPQEDDEENLDDLPQEDDESNMTMMDVGRSSNLLGDDDETEGNTMGGNQLSRFEIQQQRLQSQISTLEGEAIGEKSWTLKGEAGTKARPLNSLLEEDLEYEHAAKPVPVITEEITATLEDLIKQRIKDQLFDDVIRKAAPRDRDYDPNRRGEINDEKSTKSLAQVYEEDFVRRSTGAAKGPTEKDEALKKQHDEITDLFRTLCSDLDALSNWHFAPKPASSHDLEVVPLVNVPALEMEEVTPSHVAAGTLAAPQEVYAAPGSGSARDAQKSASELTSNDKKRLRDKARRSAGRVKRSKADLAASVAAAKPKTASDERKSKESALKQLMTQKNVTIVADQKMKNGMKRVAEGARKGKHAMQATLVEKGGKVGEGKKVEKAQFLRL
ncbi:u3 small nucleolar ribonucleoprotein MPP10 [Thoreauomyces humboldtii]|nr:u3 small nucleolar ribonucleoprotein MPP10 [Thoreauomyces humboldtii]